MADKKLQAGDLDRKLDIQVKGTHKNTKGGDDGSSFGYFASNIPCHKDERDGSEKPESNRETAFADVRFTIRYRSDITKDMRAVCEGKEYDIIAVREGAERRQWTILDCKTRD